MLGLSRLHFTAGTIIPAHSHAGYQICLLVRGQLRLWKARDLGSLPALLHPGSFWVAGPRTEHSILVSENSEVIRIEFSLVCLRKGSNLTVIRRSLTIAALLTIQAARACSPTELHASATDCDYSLVDLERDQQSGMLFDVPDCFFNNLESAAAGGDPQAQVELGITLMQGLSPDPGDAMLGPYWLKRAAASGHPSAQKLLDAYMEDISC